MEFIYTMHSHTYIARILYSNYIEYLQVYVVVCIMCVLVYTWKDT